MARYIDADKTVWSVTNNDKYGTITKEVFVSLLQNADTADVAPVVHAHWVEFENPNYSPFDNTPKKIVLCSHCGNGHGAKDNYCCVCGAKMDEEEQV